MAKFHSKFSARARALSFTGLALVAILAWLAFPLRSQTANAAPPVRTKPTVVLVHGAFAESESWNPVISRLLSKGYPVVAAANPLRGVQNDAAYVTSILRSISGPIILVGHSYGGTVITNAAIPNVKALVYVAGFAPEAGESAALLAGKFPGGTLGPTLAPPVLLANGSKDLYIRQDKFRAQFAADVPEAQAKLMAAGQRPITEAALNEPSAAPAWKKLPSWFYYGTLDNNIPRAAHAFMAKRAGAKRAVEINGASHVVMVTHPDGLVKLVDEAASSIE